MTERPSIVDARQEPHATISVVIPAYNEEDNVERAYERLAEVLSELDVQWELIFSVDPLARPHRGAGPRAPRA